MRVPLLDLKAQYEAIGDEVVERFMAVVEGQQFILGPPVAELEAAVAQYTHSQFAVGVASGTDALLLSFLLLDLQPGDEVITTPFTFFATAGAIHNAGGTPVFADIERDSFNIDPDAVAAAITPRTRAIVPVHLYGQMARMEALVSLAAERGLALIEDAAQAIGARRHMGDAWRMAGEIGMTGCFSFFPSKNLGAWGDAGMIVTQDDATATRLRRLRTHGGAKQYHHDEVGTNSRLDTLQAAVLLAKLPHLDAWAAARRERAARYDQAFAPLDGVCAPPVDSGNEHVYHQYTIRARERDGLKRHLDAEGIGCAVYYPKALHQQPCFQELGYRDGSMPEAERATAEVLSLPVYPELTDAQQDRVIEAIQSFYA